MPLAVGTRLGSIEIADPLGAGGMGEVYRGRDTKLDREVAVKVLPASVARDPERLARFEREAKVLASLNHPNIAQIYGVQEADGYQALVMELVPGQTLAARIKVGAIPLDESLRLAAQMVDALGAAHDKGVTHRDFKPANVMITPEGVVKVLDFGLAAVSQPRDAPTGTNVATLTMSPTSAGVIMGTAPYMSPEQARGAQADRRSDIFSFGVVLYEMLTGKQLFHGETVSDVLASVLKDDPNLDGVPEQVRPLLKRCLEKDPKKRLQALGDWDLLLTIGGDSSGGAGSQPAAEASASASRLSKIALAGAAVFALVAAGLGVVAYRHTTEEPPRNLKMSVLPPEKAVFKPNSLPAISPDGRHLAFAATLDGKDSLWVRDLDALVARPLVGTDGADEPFWSPDSRTIAFFADQRLKKIDLGGGPVLTLCDGVNGRGGTWNKDDVILFGANGSGIFRVPAVGGLATQVTTPDNTSGDHRFPWFLPDGHHFLYTATGGEAGIYAASIDARGGKQDPKKVATDRSNAVYADLGFLLFVREGTLMAQPFDAAKLATTGAAVPLAERVDAGAGKATQNQFSVSQSGLLVYLSGGSAAGAQLTWFDRSGKVMGTLGAPNSVSGGAISPDGKTVAADRIDGANTDIWLHDLARGTASRFTFGPQINEFPVWSPDGSSLAFYSTRENPGRGFKKAVGGTRHEEMLSPAIGAPPHTTRIDDWSRDGRYLILEGSDAKTKFDLWAMPLFGDRKPFPLLTSEFNERWGRLSPDGKWLAYSSDESKRNEIYVTTFPDHAGKWQISTDGGSRSVWSKDGKELYFRRADDKIMAVPVKGGAPFEAGKPEPLFDVRSPGGSDPWFDVSKDGRFLIPVIGQQTSSIPMTVVLNWQTGLKK